MQFVAYLQDKTALKFVVTPGVRKFRSTGYRSD
jgi:hypothetical protein